MSNKVQLYGIDCECGDDGWEVYVYDGTENMQYVRNYYDMHKGHSYTVRISDVVIPQKVSGVESDVGKKAVI